MVPWTTLYPLRRRELDLGGLRVTVDEIDGRFSGLRERLKWETEVSLDGTCLRCTRIP
jgi:hypothetical protein